jgi:hypothetical protein
LGPGAAPPELRKAQEFGSFEQQEQSLGLDAVKGEVGSVGEVLGGVAADHCLRNAGKDAVLQGIAQRADGLVVSRPFFNA